MMFTILCLLRHNIWNLWILLPCGLVEGKEPVEGGKVAGTAQWRLKRSLIVWQFVCLLFSLTEKVGLGPKCPQPWRFGDRLITKAWGHSKTRSWGFSEYTSNACCLGWSWPHWTLIKGWMQPDLGAGGCIFPASSNLCYISFSTASLNTN